MELSSRRSNLVSSTFFIAAGDTLVAVLAGFVVFPLAFSFGLEPGAGPGLISRTLPIAFAQLPRGYWVALGFFILLSFARHPLIDFALRGRISLFHR